MKKTALFLAFFALLAVSGFAQTYLVTVSGQVTDLNNIPVPNHDVYIYFDSTGNFVYNNTVQTDASGNYSDAIQVPTSAGQSTIIVGTADCNQQIQNQMRTYTPGPATFSGIDFQVCTVPTSTCNAGFTQSNTPANPAVWMFTDQSSSSSNIISWVWDFGDGNTSTAQNPIHTYAAPGLYNVCLTITNSTNCSSTDCDSLFFQNSVTYCSVGLNETSVGNTTSFSANPSGSGTATGYSWDFGDGNTAATTVPNISHTYATTGNYNACVTALFSDSCTATGCTTVGIGTCQANFTHYPDSTGQYTIIGINNSTGSGLVYFWDFGDGNSSTQQYPIHQYAGAGTYVICLTVTSNVQNCTSTFCDSVVVTQKINTPFTFAVLNPATGISDTEIDAENIQLFPNPASDLVSLHLELSSTVDVNVQLVDIQGRTLRQIDAGDLGMGAHDFRLETNDLPAGLYLTRIQIGNQSITKKLMIRK